ncbi:ATP-binding protein [Kitasatospora sp. NPDC048365]|uniref:ATP-binding protein n=1 Tax=Kitasatospora sp. NPDC048365 TaxID=3364050 RepID=UPI003720B7C0
MPTFRIRLMSSESAVPVARKRLLRQLELWCGPLRDSDTEVMELLTSELVTNAVRYGRTTVVALHVTVTPANTVVVGVVDRNPQVPQSRKADDDAEAGRGLFLVEALAERFGMQATAEGKTAWFERTLETPIPASLWESPAVVTAVDDSPQCRRALLDARVRAQVPRPRVGVLRLPRLVRPFGVAGVADYGTPFGRRLRRPGSSE